MYTIVDLGDFDGGELMALNSNGQCVGWATNVPDAPRTVDSFLIDCERRLNLGPLGDELMTFAHSLNAVGEVVGFTESYDKQEDAFLWRDGTMTALPSLGGHHSAAFAINDDGQAVGFSYSGAPNDPYTQACVWRSGAVTALSHEALGDPPVGERRGSVAYAVNAHGQIAGDVLVRDIVRGGRACVWRDGQQIILSADLPKEFQHYDQGIFSHASAINDLGQVVGWIGLEERQARACLWEKGGVHLIKGLAGHHSQAYDINIHGQVVGVVYAPYTLSPYGSFAYVWESGHMADLNTLLQDGDEWNLAAANGINDAGQIIASGEFRGEKRSVLLVPRLM